MKKIFLLTLLFFSVLPAAAQKITLANQHNFRQEISRLFAREQQASATLAAQYAQAQKQHYTSTQTTVDTSSSIPGNLSQKVHRAYASQTNAFKRPEKQWQIALFLAAESRPFGETLGTIKWLVRKGFLRRAAILRAPNGTDNGQLYFVYNSPNGAVTEKLQIDSSVTSTDLLFHLFSNMETGDSLYNAILVDAHGGGMEMSYAKDSWLEVEDLLQALQKADLQTDILNLDSCHMGSFYTVYQIARYKNVKYLLASSDFMYAPSDKMYYLLLQNLHLPPRQAAVNTTRQKKNLFTFSAQYEVNNSLAIDLRPLYTVAEEWFKSYGVFMFSLEDPGKQQLNAPFDPRLGEVRSLHKIIRRQLAYFENNEKELYNLWNTACYFKSAYDEFIQNSQKMLEALEESVLEQWCYSPQLNKIYNNHIPANIDCADGISVTQEQLSRLLDEQSEMLENESFCWHR